MHPDFSVFGIRLMTFPMIIFAALVVCVATYMISPVYKRFYQALVFGMCLPVIAFAAVGARLVSALTLMTTSERSFWYHLIYGGSVFYGGLLGGILGVWIVCRKNRYEFTAFSDLFATLLPLGHGIGRLGCYFNGCCYGRVYSGVFSVNYIIDGAAARVFPTCFFESAFCLTLFVYFQFVHRNNACGSRTAVYMIAYSVFRFLIEFMRGDEIRGHIGGLSSSQLISIFVLLAGLAVLHMSRRHDRDNYLFTGRDKK